MTHNDNECPYKGIVDEIKKEIDMAVEEDDVIIEEWLHKNGNIVHPRAVIIRSTCAEQTKQQILNNQKIVSILKRELYKDSEGWQISEKYLKQILEKLGEQK